MPEIQRTNLGVDSTNGVDSAEVVDGVDSADVVDGCDNNTLLAMQRTSPGVGPF